MTARPERVLQKVRQWVAYADEDLELAQHALGMGRRCPHRLVAYHAQQCAEKYLKAYLVHRGVDFPYTHNITLLLELCQPSAEWSADLQEADTLTRFSVRARYPGEDVIVSPESAAQAVTVASRVQTAVRQMLAVEGVYL